MLLSKDMKNELMIDTKTGKLFLRPLTDEELQQIEEQKRYDELLKIQSRYENAEQQLNALLEEGFELEEILELTLTFAE